MGRRGPRVVLMTKRPDNHKTNEAKSPKAQKSYKTNEAITGKTSENMTKRIEAKFMKNREKGKIFTKPIEPVTKIPLAKSQNEANL